jgi:nucleoside-diphosphate-sugar epimerase
VNIATGRRVSLKQLLRHLAKEIGRPARAEHRDPRPGDVQHSLADIRQARKIIGYRPKVDLETGIRRTVDWYRESAAGERLPARAAGR